MTFKNTDFYGKEVADAIQKASEELQVPQEQLEIEVVETGSSGIFGLIRKKAHIRAHVKKAAPASGRPDGDKEQAVEEKTAAPVVPEKEEQEKAVPEVQKPAIEPEEEYPEKAPRQEAASEPEMAADTDDEADDEDEDAEILPEQAQEEEELPEESLLLIRDELSRILDLMGYPSPVEVSASGNSVLCHVGEEHQETLTGQDGKTLDSIQYLLRKIIARKVPSRLRLSVDVGNYREKRLSELKEKALELAEMVKADGKTQVIAALSPSERRVIHMGLQEDKEIRSRSVGDGLFKKILIYKPGKSGKAAKSGGRKRNNSRGRRSQNSRKKSE